MQSCLKEIRLELEQFHVSVRNLSDSVQGVGIEWNDDKFKALSGLIKDIANSSKQVLSTGQRVCGTLSKFANTASKEV